MMWSVDSRDGVAGTTDAQVLRNVEQGLRPGAIVLMHENRGQTIQALHRILPAVRRKHMQPVTVTQLLERDPPTREQLDRARSGCPRQTGRVSLGS